MKVLGIESSCDDTGIALIDGNKIVCNVILKQTHKTGVIPEYAARAHHAALYENAMKVLAGQKIDLISYTRGPGLIGSLFVGACFAKGLAYALDVPSIGVNHLEGHIILPHWLYPELTFPYLCLLISGGHTMIVLVRALGGYEILSTTLDDAVGEVLDKVARKIGLDYPGGPHIEKHAKDAKHLHEFRFPNVMEHSDSFSFSGLKTAAIEQVDENITSDERADFCDAFQGHIAKLLVEKMERIHNKISSMLPIPHWVISGGVAANKTICARFEEAAHMRNVRIWYPPLEICTDNGVMIAALGQLRFKQDGASGLDIKPDAQLKFV